MIKEEIEEAKAARAKTGDDLVKSTSPYYRDCIAVPMGKDAGFALRIEEMSLRKVKALTTLLMTLQGRRMRNGTVGDDDEEGQKK